MENEEINPGQAKLSTTVIEPDAYGGHAPNVQTAIQRFNLKRSSTRNESKVDLSHDRIQRSLQDCKVNNNLTKLQSLMRSSSGTLFKRKCNALITILETLLVPADYKVRIDDLCVKSEKVKGFMDFQDGLNTFIDVTELNTLDVREDDLRARFRDAILDKNHGLRCILFKHMNGHQYIILDNDEFDMVPFLQEITFDDGMVKTNADQKLLPLLTSDFIQTAIKHMDTEFDRMILKAVLGSFLNYDELHQVGFVPEVAKRHLEHLKQVFTELEHTNLAAKDMFFLRLRERKQRVQDSIWLLETKEKQDLSEKRLRELTGQKELLQQRLSNIDNLINGNSRVSIQKFNQAAKRLAKKLAQENRLKNRRLGAGPKLLLDSDDEEFIARAIESKSTAHGRRHDSVLYTGHRVKHRDLLSIANYSLYKRGKKLIRSATTVYNRGRPKRVDSIQGKQHSGRWCPCP